MCNFIILIKHTIKCFKISKINNIRKGGSKESCLPQVLVIYLYDGFNSCNFGL